MKSHVLLLSLLLMLGFAKAGPVKLTLPPERATLKPGPGMELVGASCLTCHSAEYISTQPVLARTAWKASVDKMRGKFGAPIQDNQVDALVEYLTTAYGKPDAPAPK